MKNRVGIEARALGSAVAIAVAYGPRPASARDKGQPPLTARQLTERVRAHVGVPPREQTVDSFDAGDPDTNMVAEDVRHEVPVEFVGAKQAFDYVD